MALRGAKCGAKVSFTKQVSWNVESGERTVQIVLHEDFNTVTQRDVRGHKRMLSLILSFALVFVALISAKAFDEKKKFKYHKP